MNDIKPANHKKQKVKNNLAFVWKIWKERLLLTRFSFSFCFPNKD